jgi:hypothetical protein
MAINPNTDFTTGAVYTASQANRFPRGIMAFASVTTSDTTITSEEVQVTSASFTAVANRYYKITYVEPNITGGTGYMIPRIRLTNLAGTQLTRFDQTTGATEQNVNAVWAGTLSAGSTVIVATLTSSAGTGSAVRTATSPALLIVEDLGPA